MIWYIVGVFSALIFIGLVICIGRLKRIDEDEKFLLKYLQNYVEYLNSFIERDFGSFLINSRGKNSSKESELYSFLVRYTSKAQRKMGKNGILESYQIGNMLYRNYQLLANTINKLRFPDIHSRDFELLRNMLTMTIQEKIDAADSVRSMIKNPFKLLREGVNFIVTLPLSVLVWSGLMEYRTFAKITDNWFMRFINGVIILIGLFGSLMTLLLGWEETIEKLRHFIG
ncbi:hypothetical protein [Bacillus mesophilum]|uniref:Uncharacterized protein n=1 Tax=Bacillus mesophilum TaxID=1071718 RepID=A0A7V7UVE7_9BACI|nr:hypothetical protein [Bacillus mesophilum]KAB2332942.1 hypothetical protein F7732_12740 [Bacillus mesophilum]